MQLKSEGLQKPAKQVSCSCDLQRDNIGALIVKIGFGGPFYYTYNIIRNPQNGIGNC